MKHISLQYLLLAITLLTPHLVAANSAPKDQLHSLKLIKVENLHGQFQQTRVLSKKNIQVQSSGELFFNVNGGLLWVTTAPVFIAQLYSPSEAIKFTLNNETIQATKETDRFHKHISQTITSLIKQDWTHLQRYFSINIEHLDDVADRITLTPTHKQVKKKIQSIILFASSQIESYKILLTNEESINVTMSNLILNKEYATPCEQLASPISQICEQLKNQTTSSTPF